MIKFFRKIRQKLLSENLPGRQAGKFSKYIIYAIGEILLVVIGILIAFQVNNWNENRKKNNVELQILETIKIDLERTLLDIQNDYELHLRYQNGGNKFQRFLLGEDFPEDSIVHFFNLLSGDQHFFPNSSGYETLKSSGMNTISNDSLRLRITGAYEVGFPRVKEWDESNPRWDIGVVFHPYLKKHFFLTDELAEHQPFKSEFDSYKLKLKSIEKIRNDHDLRIELQESFKIRRKKISLSRITVHKLKEILPMINSEIDRLKKES